MNFDKTEKVIALILVVIAMAVIGCYINRNTVTDDVAITSEKENDKYIKVIVAGEVESPGEYRVKSGTRVCDVIYGAGGITLAADVEKIDLDAIAADGMTLKVPRLSDEDAPEIIPVVNINTADFKALCLIPGVGEVIARKIVDYREENGEFSDISDIMNVDGIGEKTFDKIKDYIKTEETQK